MRSTVIIDDDLFKRVRKRAAELDVTVSDVINDALREALAKKPATAAPFRLPTFGDPRRRVHHEPSDFAASEDDDDFRRVGK
jgi:hypothetical protein